MSDALDELRDQMTSWYLGLDERTRSYLEAAYAQAPGVIVNSIGATGVSADEIAQHASLASLFDADPSGDVATTFPYIGGDGPLLVEPERPVGDDAFVLRWIDVNWGASSRGYADRVAVIDAENNAVFSAEIEVPALDSGARTPIEISVADVPAGTYTLRVLHNSNGIDPAYPHYASRKVGFHSYSELMLEVAVPRTGEQSARRDDERGRAAQLVPDESEDDEQEIEAAGTPPQAAAQAMPLNLAGVPIDEAYPDPVEDFGVAPAGGNEPQPYESLVPDGGFDGGGEAESEQQT
jgi:hypothetical protein